MINANDIVKAMKSKNVVERTPLDFDRYLSENTRTIYIKKENMQRYALSNCEEPTMPFIN